MMQANRSGALLNDGGWPTLPEEAMRDTLVPAITSTPNQGLIVYGFDFAALPADLEVTGIGVRVDGYYDDTSGSGELRFKVELSYNGGGLWTSPKYTPVITTSNVTYIVGGPTDTWGRSWTYAELTDANNFRLRVTSNYKVIVDTPSWMLVYVVPVVYFKTETTEIGALKQIVSVNEKVSASRIAVAVKETLGVFDSGSTPPNGIAEEAVPHLAASGTAVSAVQSSADFSASADRFEAHEAIGVRVGMRPGAVLHIGDSTVAGLSGTGLPTLDMMQPGLMSLGEINFEGQFGGETEVPTAQVTFANKEYVAIGIGIPMTLGEIVRTYNIVGASISIFAFVESGDGWKQRLLFFGKVEDVSFDEITVTLNAVQTTTGTKLIPDIVIDETLFDYEPGSSAEHTGEQIEGNRGKPVPIGIGRFDYGAVKKPADFPTGHPFRANNEALSEAKKAYSGIALLPALLGLKHPMMPAILAARKYRRIKGQSGDQQFQSWPYQNVYLYGSRRSSPFLSCLVGHSPGDVLAQQFPGRELAGLVTWPPMQTSVYLCCFTWHQDADFSAALPVVKPINKYAYTHGESDSPPDWVYRHSGAGTMEQLGMHQPSGKWSDGRALDAYGLFVNGATPRTPAVFPGLKNWPGVWQTVAMPFVGPTKIETRTRTAYGQAKTPEFITTEGEGEGKVEDVANCMDLKNPESFTRLQNLSSLSLQCPLEGPSLGKIRGVRVCMMWNPSTSTAQNVYLFARMGPTENYPISFGDVAINQGFNRDINTLWDGSTWLDTDTNTYAQCMKIQSPLARGFASFYFTGYFDAGLNKPNVIVDGSSYTIITGGSGGSRDTQAVTLYRWRRLKGEWQFTAFDRASFTDQSWLEFPFDVMIRVRDVGETGRWLDLYAIWLEAIFQSPLTESREALVARSEPVQRRALSKPKERIPKQPIYPRPSPGFTYEFEKSSTVASAPTIYLTGKGAVDDDSGSITGVANAIIENPADSATALIRHYLGAGTFAGRATGATFGSFSTSRGLMAAAGYRLAAVVDEIASVNQVFGQFAEQSQCFFAEQIDDAGVLRWRVFFDTADPAGSDPQRLYRTNGYGFSWNRIAPGTFTATLTPIEDISSYVVVRYGWHLPTRSWAGEKYVGPNKTNFASGGAAYKAAMSASRAKYGRLSQYVYEAPFLWDPAAAEALCKWKADRHRQHRVIVEFESYRNALDLQPGHVIKFDDEIGDRVKWPGESSSNWSDHQFNVAQVFVRRDVGQPVRVSVRAEQTIGVAA